MEANLSKGVGNVRLRPLRRVKAFLAMGVLSGSIAGLVGSIFIPVGDASAQSPGLPEGPGKAFATQNCGSCHGLELLTAQRRSTEEWEEVVNRMIANGDTLNEDQYNEVIAYLGTYLGNEAVSSVAPTSPPVPSGNVTVVPSVRDGKSK